MDSADKALTVSEQVPDVEAGSQGIHSKLTTSELEEEFAPRHGNWLTACGHIITCVIGAGILSLPYAIAVLGWVGGLTSLLLFAWITLYTSQLLAEVHIIKGNRMRTYMEAVEAIMGRKGAIVLAWFQYSQLIMVALAYNITAGLSLQQVALSVCESRGTSNCLDNYWVWAAIFGGAQLLLSQMPTLDSAWISSAIGAVMSFGYSFLVLGRSISEGETHGTVGGVSMEAKDKVFGVFNSLGAILFAYGFSMILIEIQDTISDKVKEGPIKAMKKAVNVSVAIMTAFYVAVAVAGYMAFGNSVSGDILASTNHPSWLVNTANIMVVVHMGPAYQTQSQPFFGFVETSVRRMKQAPNWAKGLAFRLGFRSGYVVLLAFVSICMPFFSTIIGLVGALGFWPTTVLFPIEMWLRVYNPPPRVRFWMEALNIFCLLATLIAVVGSIYSLVTASYCFFC